MTDSSYTLLNHMQVLIEDEIRAEGVPSLKAHRAAERAVKGICRAFAGREIYFHGTVRPRIDRAAVMADFDGRNHRDLARKHKCTERTIRTIVRDETLRRGKQ